MPLSRAGSVFGAALVAPVPSRQEAQKDVGVVATSKDKKVLRVILFVDFLIMLTMYNNYKLFVTSTM